MGNCVSSNPSMPSSNSSMVSSTSQLDPDLPFIPILPHATHVSNLGAQYILGSELGRGQSGVIRNCTRRSSGALFACKSISKLRLCTASAVEDVKREVRIMRHLSRPMHPPYAYPTGLTSLHNCLPSSIVRLYDAIEDKQCIHLIMELCRGGDLFNRIVNKKCYPEAHAAFIIKTLFETLQFCHSKGIIHRDIKPENILLVEDCDTSPIKLADFGLALEFSPGQKFSGLVGSTYYIAPEVLQGEYSQEVDVWSVGVIMYVLLSGAPPFSGTTEQRIFKAIQKGDLRFPSNPWDKISSSAKDLITQLLHANAELRLTPAQALNHPWILHHTKVPEHVNQSNAMLNSLSIGKSAQNLGSHESSSASDHNQTLVWAGSMSKAAKPRLSKILMHITASMERDMGSMHHNLPGQRVQSGWTCTVLSLNGNVETFVVEMGGQEKYLVTHDKIKKRIRWKVLSETAIPQP